MLHTSPDAVGIRPAAAPAPLAVVLVPTFRRPDLLARTLASLARQDAPFPFRVVVVDNDADGREGEAVAAGVFAAGDLAGTVVCEPRQGNCYAINRAFEVAAETVPGARYFLMIDDDETASPGWLRLMVETCEATGADVVGGPVEPVFENTPGDGVRGHPVFWPAFGRTGPVPMIYGSGNFLIRRDALEVLEMPRFDTRFNFLGGGDTDFFTRCRRAGFVFHWCAEAGISEIVPPARTRTGWILRRGLRIGAINYLIDSRYTPPGLAGVLRVQAKNMLLLPIGAWRGFKILLRGRGLIQASHPFVVALGRVSASLGFETEQYRARKPGA